jgi:flagellar assembly protein FliH
MSSDSQLVEPLSLPRLSGSPTVTEDIEAARQRGFSVGYAAGARRAQNELAAATAAQKAAHEQALADMTASFQSAAAALNASAQQLHSILLPTLMDAEIALGAAAIALAEAILGAELSTSNEGGARAAVQRVLGHPDAGQILTIRLHPTDAAYVTSSSALPDRVTVISDPTLARGDAIAVLPAGYIDGRISTALARATAALAG